MKMNVFGYENVHFGPGHHHFQVTKFGNLLLTFNQHLHHIQIIQHDAVDYSSLQGNPHGLEG